MRWTAPTLHDHLPTLPARAYAARVVSAGWDQNHSATCDRCGRTTSADMLLDVRMLDPDTRAPLGLDSEAFICDACRERLIRTTNTQRARLYQLLGAPDEIVDEIHHFSLRKGDDPTND